MAMTLLSVTVDVNELIMFARAMTSLKLFFMKVSFTSRLVLRGFAGKPCCFAFQFTLRSAFIVIFVFATLNWMVYSKPHGYMFGSQRAQTLIFAFCY